MGGTTSITLRKPDSTEFRMTRWTNSMPWGVCNPRMFNADEKHMDEYLHQWLKMKDDWDRNHIGGKFENEMTDCYFPSAGLAPCGYGLTVVDHVNNVILDMQGYTSFHNMNVAGIALDITKTDEGRYECRMDDSNFLCFKEFLEDDRIVGVEVINKEKNGLDVIPLPTKDLSKLVDIIGNYDNPLKNKWFNFALDIHPFTIERFEECDSAETERMRQRVLELGFVLTDAENAEWDDFIAQLKEYELEVEQEDE